MGVDVLPYELAAEPGHWLVGMRGPDAPALPDGIVTVSHGDKVPLVMVCLSLCAAPQVYLNLSILASDTCVL